jgi:hypothetical protein
MAGRQVDRDVGLGVEPGGPHAAATSKVDVPDDPTGAISPLSPIDTGVTGPSVGQMVFDDLERSVQVLQAEVQRLEERVRVLEGGSPIRPTSEDSTGGMEYGSPIRPTSQDSTGGMDR